MLAHLTYGTINIKPILGHQIIKMAVSPKCLWTLFKTIGVRVVTKVLIQINSSQWHCGFDLVRVTVAVLKRHEESNLERRGFIWLTLPHLCSSSKEVRQEFTQGRDLEAGAGVEGRCLLACFLWLAQPAFL